MIQSFVNKKANKKIDWKDEANKKLCLNIIFLLEQSRSDLIFQFFNFFVISIVERDIYFI